MRRERGVLLVDVLLAAGGTVDLRRFGRTPNQLFEFGVAIRALIFVDRHNNYMMH
jgi:hypothetical protein